MGADGEFRHRPGAFKQQNKTHKTGRHKSKGALQKEVKGRVSVKTIGKKAKKELNRNNRRNKSLQIRKQKREEVLTKKRSRGLPGTPPFLVAVVPLCGELDTSAVLELIKTADDLATVTTNDMGITHISVPRFKQRFSFVCPKYGDLYGTLDAAKVADTLMLVTSAEKCVEDYANHCLSCLFAQGMPSSILAVTGLRNLSVKKQAEVKKVITRQLEKRFPGEKLHTLDSVQDGLMILRAVGSIKQRPITLRDHRPHMIAEALSYELPSEDSPHGTLKITGFVRGQALNVNGLVHLPGWGDFQMSQLDAPEDPYTPTHCNKGLQKKGNMDVEMEDVNAEVRVLECVDPQQQESLQSEVIPDPMEGEQTWPTDEELAEAENVMQAKRTVKRVPKGTSEYQAAWIVDSGDEEEEDNEDESEDEDMEDDQSVDSDCNEELGEGQEEEYESIAVTDDTAKYDAAIDMDEETKALEKLKESRLEQMFPDEVDTPMDTPARIRFQKYRGLKSFRTSPWDPKENLPADYARIFQFENFKRTKKRLLGEDRDEAGALPGWYITVHIANVPREFMESYTEGSPVVLYGLLPHEQKMSVMHFLLRHHPSNMSPVKSKERMVFHVGYRRFAACPVYSQHTNGDKHKFERFFRADAVTVATVFAPVLFPPASVLMFKEMKSGQHELVAVGSVLAVNPDRIIAKRIVLSGHPFKIQRKQAVIRYMFFNREDINWFKPLELRTKYGRRGHIREPLGTHGHMKCTFDSQLTSMDTILMNLYKRVYPKWTYETQIRNPPISTAVIETGMDTQHITEEFFD